MDESFAVGYYINIDFARSRMEFKSGVRMTERGGQMFPYEVELERPLSSKTGECFHVDVIVSGTILEVYVDNRIALGTRMFDIKGGNFGLYASDAEANFMNIQIFKKNIKLFEIQMYFLVLCYNSDTQSFEDMKLEEKTDVWT